MYEISGIKRDLSSKYYKPPKPNCKPTFPARLSDLSDEELMDLYGQFTEWQVFAISEVGELDADKIMAKNHYDTLKKQRMLKLKVVSGKSDIKKFELENEAESSEEVIEARNAWVLLDAKHTLEKAYLEAYDKNTAALSRDLTRRKESNTNQRRSDSFVREYDVSETDDYEDAKEKEVSGDSSIFEFEG